MKLVRLRQVLSSPRCGGYSLGHAEKLDRNLLSSPRCGGYSLGHAEKLDQNLLSSPRCGGYSTALAIFKVYTYFLPRVAGVTLIQIVYDLKRADFLPRVAGVTPMYLPVTIKTKGFLPRIAGVTLGEGTHKWQRHFLPRVAGVTLHVDEKSPHMHMLSSPHSGGHSFDFTKEIKKIELSSPHSGGHSRLPNFKASLTAFLPRIAGVTLCKELSYYGVLFSPPSGGHSKKTETDRLFVLSSPPSGGYNLYYYF